MSGCLIVDSDDERDFEVVDNKVYMYVSYSEKDRAKQIGAKWCPAKKSWYIFSNEQEKYDALRAMNIEINHDLTTCETKFKSKQSTITVYPKRDDGKPLLWVDYSKFVIAKGHCGRGDNCD